MNSRLGMMLVIAIVSIKSAPAYSRDKTPSKPVIAGPAPQPVLNPTPTPQPQPAAKKKPQVIYMKPTVYNHPFYNLDEDTELQQQCQGNENKTVVGLNDQIIMRNLCRKVYMNCLMQGTCTILKDTQMMKLKYVDTKRDKNGRVTKYLFKMDDSECEFGYGASQVCLVPYKSIAVDWRLYRYHTVFYVPTLKRVDEKTKKVIHDGCFVAHDAGGAIKGYGRFDFYIGDDNYKNPDNDFIRDFIDNKIQGKKRIPYQQLSRSQAKRICVATDFSFVKASG